MSRLSTPPPSVEPKEFTLTNVNYHVRQGYGTRQDSDEGKPKALHKNFRNQFPKTERDIYELLSWPERWDGYDAPKPNPASVTHARSWAEQLHRDVSAELWIKPHVIADEEGDVVFEWWKGRKKIAVYISPEAAEYVKVERLDGSSNMEDGSIETPEDRRMLWRWLIT